MMSSTLRAATVRYAFAKRFEVRQPIRQAGVLNNLSVELSTIVLTHTSVRVEHVKASALSSCCQQVANLIVVRWKAVPYANDETRHGERRAREFPCRLKRFGRPFAPDRSDQQCVTSNRRTTIVIVLRPTVALGP
jgi:hypothetical protein